MTFGKLKNALRLILSSEGNQLDIRNIRYLPRWLVLCFDITIVVSAIFLSVFLLYDLGIKPLSTLHWGVQVALLAGVNTFFFFLYRSYSGLIRHSSYMDALKLLLASVSTLFCMLCINGLAKVFIGDKIYLTTGLIIYTIISFLSLFIFRLSVKQLYEFFKVAQKEESLIKAVILGIDENAISIASALDLEHPKRFEVKGFISNRLIKNRLRILDKPVAITNGDIVKSIENLNANAIILTAAIDANTKQEIVEQCLDKNIQIYNSPLISTWAEDQNVPTIQKLQIEDLLEREPIVLNEKNKAHQLQDKTILVTGGAGSIGSEIVRQVAQYKPGKLLILDQAETPLHSINLEISENFPELDFECIICDVCNKNRLKRIFSAYNIEVIYHAAAYKHVPLMEQNPHEAVFTNILGTKLLADCAVEHHVERFVMVSTDKAVNPSNVMGASKRASEMYVQSLNYSYSKKENSTKFITTRFGNVLGSNGSVVPLFKRQIEEGGPVTITHPDIIRYFMTIPEACQLVLEAGAMGKGGEIFIFDMGEPVKIMDLACKMIKLAGFTPNKDINVEITGLRPGEKLYEELLSNETTTLPTHHEKIMITKDRNDDYPSINASIENIIKSAIRYDNNKVVHKLKTLIPEFKSKNSEFELLDSSVDFEVLDDSNEEIESTL